MKLSSQLNIHHRWGILAPRRAYSVSLGSRKVRVILIRKWIKSVSGLSSFNPQSLKVLVAQQPVTATIGADLRFQRYQGGVIDGPNYSLRRIVKRKIGHSVAIVGYGELKGLLFWLIKNSWDVYWGLWGFGFIARNTGKRGGAFGIAREIFYPVKVGPNSLFVRASKEIESSDDLAEENM